MDIESIHVLGPRLLVKLDEEPELFSGGLIVKPETVHETAEIEGTVLGVGTGYSITEAPGRKPINNIRVGDKVCFIKFHRETVENPQIQAMLGEGIILIKIQDVLYLRRENEEGEDKLQDR